MDYPIEVLFADVPSTRVEAELREQGLTSPSGRVSVPYTFQLVQAGGRRVLVDTGIGRPPVEALEAAGHSPAGPYTFGRS